MEEKQTITQSQAEHIYARIMQEFPGVEFRKIPLTTNGEILFIFKFLSPKFSLDEAQITAKQINARMKKIAEEEKKKETERISIAEFAKSIEAPPFASKIHELIEKNSWEQAKIEEKIAVQKIAGMWEIVKKVATTYSTYYDEGIGLYDCPFCNGSDDRSYGTDHIKHEDDCIVLKARRLVQEESAK